LNSPVDVNKAAQHPPKTLELLKNDRSSNLVPSPVIRMPLTRTFIFKTLKITIYKEASFIASENCKDGEIKGTDILDGIPIFLFSEELPAYSSTSKS